MKFYCLGAADRGIRATRLQNESCSLLYALFMMVVQFVEHDEEKKVYSENLNTSVRKSCFLDYSLSRPH